MASLMIVIGVLIVVLSGAWYVVNGISGVIRGLRSDLASEKLANKALRSRARQLDTAIGIFRGTNESLHRRLYNAERERDAALALLSTAVLRDPVTGRLLPKRKH